MIEFTIHGEAASKANSRQIVKRGDRLASIKSAKALGFERDSLYQIPQWARQRIDSPVSVTLRMFYATERPDLDESLLLDILQDRWVKHRATGEKILAQAGVYRNDRLVREKHIYHGIDRANPRVEIKIEPIIGIAQDLFA